MELLGEYTFIAIIMVLYRSKNILNMFDAIRWITEKIKVCNMHMDKNVNVTNVLTELLQAMVLSTLENCVDYVLVFGL